MRSPCPSFLSTEIPPEANKPPTSRRGAHHAPRQPGVSFICFIISSHVCVTVVFLLPILKLSVSVYEQGMKYHDTSHSPNSNLATFHTEPLAWFRVEEYSGLTGRKGTTVVSVTKVLWFCVASQTSQRKRAKRQNLTTAAGPRLCREAWLMHCEGNLGKHTWRPTCAQAHVYTRVMRTAATGHEKPRPAAGRRRPLGAEA